MIKIMGYVFYLVSLLLIVTGCSPRGTQNDNEKHSQLYL